MYILHSLCFQALSRLINLRYIAPSLHINYSIEVSIPDINVPTCQGLSIDVILQNF